VGQRKGIIASGNIEKGERDSILEIFYGGPAGKENPARQWLATSREVSRNRHCEP
jgi:hypothetical protein